LAKNNKFCDYSYLFELLIFVLNAQKSEKSEVFEHLSDIYLVFKNFLNEKFNKNKKLLQK
jgi:hypothetical protein